jgi:hypothetical protein
MQIENVGSHQTEVQTDKARILFSYKTPVAAWISGRGYVRTSQFWSVTTSKHINMWLRDNYCNPDEVQKVPQSELDNLL